MVKKLYAANRQGLNDWLVQRFSAVFLLVCIIALVAFFAMHPGLSYAEWHGLFHSLTVRVITGLFFLSLLWHAWIGIWTVVTDYIHCGWIRACLNAAVLLALIGFFLATLFILWSV